MKGRRQELTFCPVELHVVVNKITRRKLETRLTLTILVILCNVNDFLSYNHSLSFSVLLVSKLCLSLNSSIMCQEYILLPE